eukprot:CAMPEP_0176356502 /NCGR_PEP_ID=MMETSP0126-20121128/14060_1 /TAXON_ID=141414 ORGANISM="Strombidinopsis acuminatum, Strain SPMC142" /NCGR_SAMPLE_ID=MMETSP0126 /ASSEMBLY_ACC=CAM_ASM_000229 /LENGTH=58 /DNA_ID=CAMNT_0017709619 /DNA_START=929 /DNA_END=1105 /DNA_ORIENTATION=+
MAQAETLSQMTQFPANNSASPVPVYFQSAINKSGKATDLQLLDKNGNQIKLDNDDQKS